MVFLRKYRYVSFCFEKEAASGFPSKDLEYQKILEDENFIFYVSGIFGVMNHFNRYLQGPDIYITDFATKLTAFF